MTSKFQTSCQTQHRTDEYKTSKPDCKKKRDARPVRVIAVRHPPTGSLSNKSLAAQSAYVIDHGYAEFFQAVAELMPTDKELFHAKPDEFMALGERILKYTCEHEPHVTDAEVPVLMAAALSLCQEKIHQGIYQGTKCNPVHALEAFTTFHRLGLYPPLWVLNWLNDAFVACLKSGGTENLQTLLGVTRRKGQTPIFKEAAAVSTESATMREIAGLTLLGISIQDAAFMVEQRLRNEKIKCPSADTLAARFVKKGWSRIAKSQKAVAKLITPETKTKLLAAYARHTIPQKFR
jgi:hypothetical protein